MAEPKDLIQVEVVYATNAQQKLIKIDLPQHSTIKDAIGRCGLFSDFVPPDLPVGIFGQLRALESVLANGDRVEIYSPLLIEPKAARHKQVARELKLKRQAKQARETKKKQELRSNTRHPGQETTK